MIIIEKIRNQNSQLGLGSSARLGLSYPTPVIGVSETLHSPLYTLQAGNKQATIVSAYAPAITNSDEAKVKFYVSIVFDLDYTGENS